MSRRPSRALSVAAKLAVLLLLIIAAAFAETTTTTASGDGDGGGGDGATTTTTSVPAQHEQLQYQQPQEQHSHSTWRVSPLPQSGIEKGAKVQRRIEGRGIRRPAQNGGFFFFFKSRELPTNPENGKKKLEPKNTEIASSPLAASLAAAATGSPGAGDACLAVALREALSAGGERAGGAAGEGGGAKNNDDELKSPRPPPSPSPPSPLPSCDRLDHGARVRLSLALLGCQAAALGEKLPACVSDAAVLGGSGGKGGGSGGGLLFGKKKRRGKNGNDAASSSSISNVAAGACVRSLDDRHYATFNEFFVHVGT